MDTVDSMEGLKLCWGTGFAWPGLCTGASDTVELRSGLSWMHAVTTGREMLGQGLVGGWIAADRLFSALTSLVATLQDSYSSRPSKFGVFRYGFNAVKMQSNAVMINLTSLHHARTHSAGSIISALTDLCRVA